MVIQDMKKYREQDINLTYFPTNNLQAPNMQYLHKELEILLRQADEIEMIEVKLILIVIKIL